MSSDREARAAKRLQAFRELAGERIGRINVVWIQLEASPIDTDGAEELLRELHTLKGEASLMGFASAAQAGHALEELVQRVALAGETPAPSVGDVLLDGLDLLGALIQSSPSNEDARVTALEGSVAALFGGKAPEVAGEPQAAREAPAEEPVAKRSGDNKPLAIRGQESVRVSTQQLERMRGVIGELLLTRIRAASAAEDLGGIRDSVRTASAPRALLASDIGGVEARLHDDVARMANLIGALEDLTRELRMVPVGQLFDAMPRGARELARELGREVKVVTEGNSVEADRQIIEALGEPLLHLLRNAVDHGIEAPEARAAAGKDRTGTIALRAEVVGDSIRVEMADDGGGIDVDVVRSRALEMGLLDAPSARVLNDDQVLSYLFSSGFSTRTQVSEISGRGVGLDVVKAAVKDLGGTVNVQSERGVGTRFELTVPITASITSVLLFKVGQERYALPAAKVVSIADRNTYPEIDSLDGASLRTPDGLALLVPLHKVLGCGEVDDRGGRVLMVRAERGVIALTGTSSHYEREAVILPPGEGAEAGGLVVGGVALEDGAVSLVLDPSEVRRTARNAGAKWRGSGDASRSSEGRRVLVAEDSPIMRDIVAESLRAYGLEVIEVGDGAEALEMLEANAHIDLLVTDLEMPRVDGFELIERMRARVGARRIPAVVVSTRGSDADKLAAMEVGADAYLVKSEFSREGLWATVSRFV